jgi:uncharacterized protein YceH (UPF0502 family)
MSDSFDSDDIEEAGEPDEMVRLSFEEARVLGCLLEKESTTTEYYPLTLKALESACNQSSNREPVTSFDSSTVEEAMEGLRYKGFSLLVHQANARVPKNKHTIERQFPYLTEAERALLCVLMLRGQQTLGELRQRTERMHHFASIESTEASLEKLIRNEPHPLVKLIPAGGGRRVPTYVHLLCGEPVESEMASSPVHRPAESVVAGPTWREEMEQQMATLKAEVETLRGEMKQLREELGG